MKRLFKFRYPKITILLISIILSYIILRNPDVSSFIQNLGDMSYFGIFISGMIFAFGFTAPFAVGFFLTLNPQSIILAGIIGGAGALVADLIIFKFIRISFTDEFNQLERTKALRKVALLIEKKLKHKLTVYIMYALAGIMIASPLPDEAGIIMLAGLTKIKMHSLAILSFLLNTLGIIIILLI